MQNNSTSESGTLSGQTPSILVTGANGFIGRALCFEAHQQGWHVKAAVRSVTPLIGGAEPMMVGSINGETEWADVLRGVDAVVHLAGRAHILRETAKDPLAEFLRVNAIGTERLARAAANAHVRQFIFISSIGVNGNVTDNSPFSEEDQPRPHNAYAVSKLEAEQALHRVAQETGLEVVIVRPPLVYGPGVGANFLRLLQLVKRGVPLPFGLIKNQRSLVYVGNLVDAIITCLEHPAAAGQTYLVSDGEDVSTPALIRRIATSLGRPARLLPVPPAMLRLAGQLTGKSAQVERLLDSLVIDSSKIRRELGWTPPFTMEQGLAETAEWFQGGGGRA